MCMVVVARRERRHVQSSLHSCEHGSALVEDGLTQLTQLQSSMSVQRHALIGHHCNVIGAIFELWCVSSLLERRRRHICSTVLKCTALLIGTRCSDSARTCPTRRRLLYGAPDAGVAIRPLTKGSVAGRKRIERSAFMHSTFLSALPTPVLVNTPFRWEVRPCFSNLNTQGVIM